MEANKLHVGKTMEYYTHDGRKGTARVEDVVYHEQLGKPLFIGVSPFGNPVRLTRDEIHRFI